MSRSARREGHAGATRVVIDDDLEIELEVLMATPVPIDDGAFVDRALCRVAAGDAIETGWSSCVAAR